MIEIKITPHLYSYVEPIIIRSLIDNPDNWEIDDYWADNQKLKVHIWIGRGRGYLKVQIDGELIIGGFALMPLAPWRWRLWNTIQKRRAFTRLEKFSKWVEDATV